MNMSKKYIEPKENKRLHCVSCPKGYSSHDLGATSLSFQIYFWKTSLRSHALKHFCNSYELPDWQRLYNIDTARLQNKVDSLKDLGCPFFKMRCQQPPCWQGKYGRMCDKFVPCTTHMKYLEDCYQQAIVKAIEQSLQLPRNVSFRSTKEYEEYWAMGSVPVIVRMSWHGGTLQVNSSFRPQAGAPKLPWREFLNRQVRRIRGSAIAGTVIWRTEEQWGITVEEQGPDNSGRKKSNRKAGRQRRKRKAGPKKKGGARNLKMNPSFYDED